MSCANTILYMLYRKTTLLSVNRKNNTHVNVEINASLVQDTPAAALTLCDTRENEKRQPMNTSQEVPGNLDDGCHFVR